MGQLGHNRTQSLRIPKKIQFFVGETVTNIAVCDTRSAAVTVDGKLYLWGTEQQIAREDNDPVAYRALSSKTPILQRELASRNVTAVHLGESHTCAVVDGNSLFTFGNNSHGQCGLGDSSW